MDCHGQTAHGGWAISTMLDSRGRRLEIYGSQGWETRVLQGIPLRSSISSLACNSVWWLYFEESLDDF